MSYDFHIAGVDDGEPRFNDHHPGLGENVFAGTVELASDGYYRCGNYTSNVSPMWHACLSGEPEQNLGLADLDGRTCGEIAPLLANAVEWGLRNIDRLREMNPPNGWGNAEGAITYLWDIQRMCERHPDGTLAIWR